MDMLDDDNICQWQEKVQYEFKFVGLDTPGFHDPQPIATTRQGDRQKFRSFGETGIQLYLWRWTAWIPAIWGRRRWIAWFGGEVCPVTCRVVGKVGELG